MSEFDIIPARTPSLKEAFIRLPWSVYRGDPHWVPPLIRDMRSILDQDNHPFYEYGKIVPFLAMRNGVPCGRIAAILNPLHEHQYGEHAGFFGFFECIDDQDIANALFQKAGTHLRKAGMEKVYGPANPSSNYEYGLLVEGFEDSPRIMMTYNPPYYRSLIENYGFKQARQLYAWRFSYEKTMHNERLEAIAQRARTQHGFEIRPIGSRDITRRISDVKFIYNQAWEANWGHVPFTDAEFDMIARELRPILDKGLTLMAFQGDTPAGVAIAVRDINLVMKKLNGRLHLFNQIRLLWEKQRIDWIRVLILGVLPAYRRKGLDALLYHELVRSAGRLGIKHGEGSWILDNNHLMNRALSALNGTIYKRYNVYELQLEKNNDELL